MSHFVVEPFTEIIGVESTKIKYVFQNVNDKNCFAKNWQTATPLTKLKFLEILEAIPLDSKSNIPQWIGASELPLSQVIKKIERKFPYVKNIFVL